MTNPVSNPPTDSADESILPTPLYWRAGDVARAVLISLAIWFGLQLFWKVNSLVFVVFLATLFGLAVARGVDYLERYNIRRGVGSALIVFGTLGVIGGGLAWTAPTLIQQGQELQREFPAALQQVQNWVDSKRGGLWGTLLKGASAPGIRATPPEPAAIAPASGQSPLPIAPTDPTAAVASQSDAGSRTAAGQPSTGPTREVAVRNAAPSHVLQEKLTNAMAGASKYLLSFVSNTLAVLGAFVLIVFLAIYIGAEPEIYRGWLLSTVPAASRAQVRMILREMSTVLRKWLVTQLIAMVVIGVTCTVVLLLLGVKAPFALGFIAGLMEFIPTVGPIFSAVPAVLMGFVDSPQKALTVVVAYWAIQFVENNLLIPFLMRGEMDLPPAITLIAQTLMALVFGFVGLMVAVPLTAAVLVPLRMIAERENDRERAIHRLRKVAEREGETVSDQIAVVERPDDVVSDADKGPSPYTRLPSSTAALRKLP